MTKILKANAKDGKVLINGQEVPGADILSQGKAASEGVIILNELEKVYIAMPMDSIKQLLTIVAALADGVGGGVSAANGGGPIAPTLAADMAAISAKIDQLKGNLQ
ncbi:hypothetical protein AAIR98_001319 [Elusimicrobium simillimum]|uniref:hypothetical protein n=1 Tax=Elusimicrobium simillimum TaxID=3143438 RepID=UPI003C7014C1